DLKITAGSRAAALHANSGLAHAEKFSGLMFREHAGDVIIYDDDFIDFAEPLACEHSDRRRAAANTHAFFECAVNDRRLPSFDDDFRAVINRQFDRLAIAEIEKRFAGYAAFLFCSTGQVMHTAERKHLRAIFAGGNVTD